MDFLYVVPPKPAETTWRVPPQVFSQAMKRRWPDASVREIKDPSDVNALEFELSLSGTLNGELQREGQMLIITYMQDLRDLGDVVVWFRTLAPPSQELVLISGSGDYVEIASDMTAAELVQKYLGGQSRPD